MSRPIQVRRGLGVLVSGIACLVVSMALGYDLIRGVPSRPYWTGPPGHLKHDRHAEVEAELTLACRLVEGVLMLPAFGIGVWAVLIGLKTTERPIPRDHPLPPLGKLSDLFDNPE